MKLTIDQEKAIEDFVDAQGLKIRTLRDDVIDHLCCVLESRAKDELGKETSFEQLLDKAVQDLAPQGLIELQHKTVFLLNAKRIILMKKLMYLIGFISSVILTTGIACKLLRIPFGHPLFMTGLLTFLLVFIPLLAIDNYKVALAQTISIRLKIILGVVAAGIVGFSTLFKLMHLQGAEVLLMLGTVVFALGFLPFYFFTMYRKSVA